MNEERQNPQVEPEQPSGASQQHTAPEQRTAPGAEQLTDWRDFLPWEAGHATRIDKVLFGFLIGIPIFYLVLLPLRPFLIAKMPVVLALVTGAKTVVAGAGAFAAVDGFPLWVVILAGVFGMMKFDWLWWLAGYKWGARIVRLFAQNPRQQKQAEYIRNLPRWLLFVFIFFGRWPGVPGSIASLVAGWGKMPVWMFLLANGLGAVTLSTVCAWIGFALGEPAVELLKTIDKYAMWVALAIIIGTAVWSARKAQRS